ncbi:MAG: hypothetical protein U0522_02885 [Candidatus Paceibacterota bacterium]
MLNMTAVSLYLVLAGMTGTPVDSQVPLTPKTEPQVIERTKEETEKPVSTEAYVRNYFSDIPILAEVARCESQFRQTDTNGQVLRGKKNNKDVGVMQINEFYHADKAKKMGLDLHKMEDNLAYARHLYSKNGTRDWLPSSPCWAKTQNLAMRADDGITIE